MGIRNYAIMASMYCQRTSYKLIYCILEPILINLLISFLFQMKPKDVLDKYDEEIHGEKKNYFTLGKKQFIDILYILDKDLTISPIILI